MLLAVSLGVKLSLGTPANFSRQYPGIDDIVAMLANNDFKVSIASGTVDPQWVSGKRESCLLRIANVSPQGWHRAAVEWTAAGLPVVYSAGAALHQSQPILVPLLRHYLRRAERYMGIPAEALKVRAIIMSGDCPANLISRADLAALSD